MSDNVVPTRTSHGASTAEGDAQPVSTILLQMMNGYWVSQAIAVVATLGIADLVADRPVSCEALATATQTHAPSLYRVLRALASVGIFVETTPGHFALTPLAAPLCSGTPYSLRAMASRQGEEQYRAWGDLLYSVRTGQSAFEHQFGMGHFEYLAQNPTASRTFNEAMIGRTSEVADGVVATYDFSAFGTIVDVGGGHGTLLATILRSNPAVRGVVFDQPHVVAGAEAFLGAAGVADRCTWVGGDFFAAVPSGGDAYVLEQILHDWDDSHCIQILERVRQAIPEHGKLLVIELVLPTGGEPFRGKWTDLNMLIMLGGRERTADEYATLFRAARFELVRVIATPVGPSVVEAIPT